MLAIIKDQKSRLFAQEPNDAVNGRARGLHGKPNGGTNLLGNEERIVERPQLHEPDTIGVAIAQLVACLNCDVRFAGPSRTGEGQQPISSKPVLRLRDLLLSSDQRGQRSRQPEALASSDLSGGNAL